MTLHFKHWLAGSVAALWVMLPMVTVTALVSYTYRSNGSLTPGMLVSTTVSDQATVEATSTANATRVVGVVVERGKTSIDIGEQAAGEVAVAHDGEVMLLVHDLAGPIAVGDSLSVSPLTGVAMRATTEAQIVGVALEPFDSSPRPGTTTTQINRQGGDTKEVRLGKIRVAFEVGANPENQLRVNLPRFLQGVGDTIGGRAVSPSRVIGAMLIMFISLVISAVLIYGSVRSALISIGRNPLSHHSIYQGMFRVILFTLLVIAAGVVTMYLALRL